MFRPKLEVADIFRRHGAAWRAANDVHLSLAQRRVMTAIEICRTRALGGHVERCEACAHSRIAYNSCRNRHCPKCQWTAAERWMQARKTELLPVPYFHVVFTLPAALGAIAFRNKARVYGLLFKAAAETLTTIAADSKHLGAEIGVTAVLHTWVQTLDHHPHVHCIVPGGGLSPDRARWVACRPGFFLPVRVLSRLFRRLFIDGLTAAFDAGEVQFFGNLAGLADHQAFLAHLAPWRRREWVVYAKQPFAGPAQVLAYLARYTHRVAIGNSRLLELTDEHVRFRWKDYRVNDRSKHKAMTLAVGEFMRRFLLHVLPDAFHRIRHFGLFASGSRRGHHGQTIRSSRRPAAMPMLRRQDDDRRDVRKRLLVLPPAQGVRQLMIAMSVSAATIDARRALGAKGRVLPFHRIPRASGESAVRLAPAILSAPRAVARSERVPAFSKSAMPAHVRTQGAPPVPESP